LIHPEADTFNTGMGKIFDFLDGGRLNAYGLGGSLMLDYEDYRPDEEIDIELTLYQYQSD
jgi:hypothetical protein